MRSNNAHDRNVSFVLKQLKISKKKERKRERERERERQTEREGVRERMSREREI